MKLSLALLAIAAQVTVAAQAGRVEDIYIARSIRESRSAPTDFCAKTRTGFGSQIYEDRFYDAVDGDARLRRLDDG